MPPLKNISQVFLLSEYLEFLVTGRASVSERFLLLFTQGDYFILGFFLDGGNLLSSLASSLGK
jgi:hypothetical protein